MCGGVRERLGVVEVRREMVLMHVRRLFACGYGGAESRWQCMTMCMKGLEVVDLVDQKCKFICICMYRHIHGTKGFRSSTQLLVKKKNG